MLGTVRNVDGTNEPFTIAGLSDGSTDIVHRECDENYQLPMAVDGQYGAGYLGITDSCKFLYNPATGKATVNCIDTTVTCVDVNDNSDICTNQPILAQGFDADGCLDNKVEKTAAVYNANCYVCNDPVTGDPVRKPVLFIPTVKADEYLNLPKDYPIKYVNALPTSPDIEDYIYAYEETINVSAETLGAIRDKYYDKSNTKSITLDGKTVVTIAADYSEWTDSDGTTHTSTRDTTFTTAEVVVEKMKAGDATNQTLYDIGSGDGGDGSLSLSTLPTSCFSDIALVDKYGKVAYCDAGICACKDSSNCTVIKHGIDNVTLTNDGYTECAECDSNVKCAWDTLCCHGRCFNCGNTSTSVLQTKCAVTIVNNIPSPNHVCATTNVTSTCIDGFRTYQHNPYNCVISCLRSGLCIDSAVNCTYDFMACSCISGLHNKLQFNTCPASHRFGLSYSGGYELGGSNCLSIGNGAHSYTEYACPQVIVGYNCYYLQNSYTDQILSSNNRIKTIKAASVGNSSSPENTYKQLELRTHLFTDTHHIDSDHACIEMDYKCVCAGNTCFEGKTKYCTTNGKWYVCCDSTKGYKCLLNEDEVSATGGRNYKTGYFADFCEAVQCIESINGLNKDTPVVAIFNPVISFIDAYGCSHTTDELVGTFSPSDTGVGNFVGIYYDTATCKPIDFSFWYTNYSISSGWTTSNNVIASNANAWVNLVGTSDTNLTCYSCCNTVAMDPNTGRLRSSGGYTTDGTACITVGSANEFNIIPSSGHDIWINYRGGATTTCIGNGATGLGNLAAAHVTSTFHGRISMEDQLCASNCQFMPYSGTAGVYGMGTNTWAHALTFAHGNFDTYYGTTVMVPFWDSDRFQWRVRADGTLRDVHTLLDDRGGQVVSNGMYFGSEQNYVGFKATSFNGFTIQDNQTCALYIEGREAAEGDSGGVAITNDGVTAFGAGDTDGVFRVVNEDNVAAGAVFKVMKDGTVYGCHPYFVRLDSQTCNAIVPSFVSYNEISELGYLGGPWVGRKTSNTPNNNWWGYAELGLYNAESGAYHDGLCVDYSGVAYATAFRSNTFSGDYGNISFSANNRVEISAANDGVVLWGPNQTSYVYAACNALYLNSGSGSITNQCPTVFEKSVYFVQPGVKTAMCISMSNGGDDIDFYACCNLGFVTYNHGDMCLVSDYDLCTSARCKICFEAPTVLVCNTSGDLCWESANACGKYQKEPDLYKDNDLYNIDCTVCDLATVSNRITLLNARLGVSTISIMTTNCGTQIANGANTRWTGEIIPLENTSTALFNGNVNIGGMIIYGGMTLTNTNTVLCGFGFVF